VRFFLVLFGFFLALTVHAGILAFGGLLVPEARSKPATITDVELVGDEKAPEKKAEPKPDPQEPPVEPEKPPESADLLKNLDVPAPSDMPALDAASLGAIEQALAGGGDGGGFGDGLSFASGGRIGGLGKGGAGDDSVANAFSMAEIDQKPHLLVNPQPIYPSQMRGKKVEGIVSVIFVVDEQGKVVEPRIEKSSHPAFERPALDAVRQWKFEPAVKAGQRVSCRMRAPLRFQPS
jgi:protein TonB